MVQSNPKNELDLLDTRSEIVKDYLKHLSVKLKRARKSQGLTQRVVAELAGITLRHYQDIEGGKIDVKLSTLFKIVNSLHLREPSLTISTDDEDLKFVRARITDDTVCIMNRNGDIVEFNDTWADFAKENKLPRKWLKGSNYFAVCRDAMTEGNLIANRIIEGFDQIDRGEKLQFSIDYTCHAPWEKRWYTATFYKLSSIEPPVYVSVHRLIKSEKSETGPTSQTDNFSHQ